MSARIARQRELQLLALAGLFLAAATGALMIAPAVRAAAWLAVEAILWAPVGILAAWAACAAVAMVVVRRALPQHDPFFLPVVYFLSGWGMLLIWRLAPGFGLRQTLWLGVGTAALVGVVAMPGDLRWLRRYRYTWLAAGLALTALTLVLGVNPSGQGDRLWLGCCGLYLQPAEILKLLLVVFLASYLSDRREQLFETMPGWSAAPAPRQSLMYFLPMLVMWGFSALILISQRDLGMSTLFFGVFILMLYLASGRWVYVAAGLVLVALAAVLGYYLFDVVRIRVEAWWNPWADPTGRSFQIVQSLIAVAAGGLTGRGPGMGAPGVIPVAHSDFIFAALAEEWGLLAVGGVVTLLALLVARGMRTALQAPTLFGQLLAGGLSGLLGLQALLIMGGVIKLTPLTGLTLPFLSYGGSSLVSAFVLVGLLLKLSASHPPLRPFAPVLRLREPEPASAARRPTPAEKGS
jgi:cell division protein FtsW (lipid II flippase)